MFLLMHVFSLLFQNKKKEFVSTTPYRLRKRLAGKDQPLQSAATVSEALCSRESVLLFSVCGSVTETM